MRHENTVPRTTDCRTFHHSAWNYSLTHLVSTAVDLAIITYTILSCGGLGAGGQEVVVTVTEEAR
jgi:hypothetical protein